MFIWSKLKKAFKHEENKLKLIKISQRTKPFILSDEQFNYIIDRLDDTCGYIIKRNELEFWIEYFVNDLYYKLEDQRECKIIKDKSHYSLKVDGKSINFNGLSAAEYFEYHYYLLGYKIIKIDRNNS